MSPNSRPRHRRGRDSTIIAVEEHFRSLRLLLLESEVHLSRDELLSVHSQIVEVSVAIRVDAFVSHLPTEILLLIFKHCIDPPSDVRCLGNAAGDIDSQPLITITHVCRTWRAASLADPSFWTHVDISWPPEQVQAWMERTQSNPVSLVFRLSGRYSSWRRSNAGTPYEILRRYGRRCGRVNVQSHSLPQCPFPSFLQLSAPLVQCLTVDSIPPDCSYDYEEEENDRPLIFAEDVSSLKALAISPVTSRLPGNSFPHLTHLYLSMDATRLDLMMYNFLHILGSAPTLQYLHVSDAILSPPYTVDIRKRIVLPSLRNLSIVNTVFPFPFYLLGHLDLPEDSIVRISNTEIIKIRGGSDEYLLVTTTPIPHLNATAELSRLEIYLTRCFLHFVAENSEDGAFWMWMGTHYNNIDWPSKWLRSSLHVIMPLSTLTTLRIFEGEPGLVVTTLLPHMRQLCELAVRWWGRRYISSKWKLESEESSDTDLEGSMDSDHVGSITAPAPAPIRWQSRFDPRLFFSVLGGKDGEPMCCPSLRVPGLEVEKSFLKYDTPYLTRMVAARSRAGHRIDTLAIRLRQRWEDPNRPGHIPSRVLAHVAKHVEVLEYGPREGRFCSFKMRDAWMDPEAEKYWTLDAAEHPNMGMQILQNRPYM